MCVGRCVMFVDSCLCLVACRSLCGVGCWFVVVGWLLVFGCRSLLIACCSLLVARCSSLVACRSVVVCLLWFLRC